MQKLTKYSFSKGDLRSVASDLRFSAPPSMHRRFVKQGFGESETAPNPQFNGAGGGEHHSKKSSSSLNEPISGTV